MKLDASATVSKTSETIPGATPGTKLSGGYTSQSFHEIGVFALNDHWSVAMINNTIKNSAANIDLQDTVATGVEWTLVPFRKTETKEIAFRVGPEASFLNLGSANSLGHLSEKSIIAFAQIYFYWVTLQDRLTFTSNVGLSKNLTYRQYYNAAVSGSASFQATRFLSFNVTGSYSYQPKSLSFPQNPDYSNPIKSSFLTGQAGKSFSFSYGVVVTLGNTTLKQRYRRWLNQ